LHPRGRDRRGRGRCLFPFLRRRGRSSLHQALARSHVPEHPRPSWAPLPDLLVRRAGCVQSCPEGGWGGAAVFGRTRWERVFVAGLGVFRVFFFWRPAATVRRHSSWVCPRASAEEEKMRPTDWAGGAFLISVDTDPMNARAPRGRSPCHVQHLLKEMREPGPSAVNPETLRESLVSVG